VVDKWWITFFDVIKRSSRSHYRWWITLGTIVLKGFFRGGVLGGWELSTSYPPVIHHLSTKLSTSQAGRICFLN